MLVVKLRVAMDEYRRKTGIRLTYGRLAELTGLSRATIESLATRVSYDTRLSTIDKLCCALNCQPEGLLAFVPDAPEKEDSGVGLED